RPGKLLKLCTALGLLSTALPKRVQRAWSDRKQVTSTLTKRQRDWSWWPIRVMRIGFTNLVLLSVVFGYIGFRKLILINPDSELGRNWWDVLYYTLQLFAGPDPLQIPGPYPTLLAISRLTAPIATMYAVLEAVWSIRAAAAGRPRMRRIGQRSTNLEDSAVAGVTVVAGTADAGQRSPCDDDEHEHSEARRNAYGQRERPMYAAAALRQSLKGHIDGLPEAQLVALATILGLSPREEPGDRPS